MSLERVLLTIRDYNTLSRKVCEFNGGKLEKSFPARSLPNVFIG